MATLLRTNPSRSRFDCEFVEKPPEAIQSECPLCLQILREPYQAPCCGQSFCQVCIEKIKTDSKPCPTCNEENFAFFHNKGLEISLHRFQVYCSHKQEGCEWKGKLGQLDDHLNLSPQPDKQLEGCEYSEIECIYCSELIKRPNITVHQNDLCPKRSFSCEYCHSYESDYDDVINNHWPVCGYHTVQCPNECGTALKRQVLENHVTRSCPKTVIDCDFHHVGCDVRLPRKDMPTHLKADLITHMSLQAASYKQLQEKVNKLESENETLKHQLETTQPQIETTHQAAEKVQQMEQQLATLQLTSKAESNTVLEIMKHFKLRVYNTVDITMHDYQQCKRLNSIWYSPPFYTHSRGYKLSLRVNADGLLRGQGTHVSVYVYLMKGEFDDLLTWPFQGKVAIKLLDRNGTGYQKTVDFKSSIPDTHNNRVTEGERSIHGLGLSMFISHITLQPHYVWNDCLNFRIKYKELKAASSSLIPVQYLMGNRSLAT